MTEKLLQYIWQFQYFNRSALYTTGGEAVQIIFPGKLNTHQGPDFADAKIKIGATVLAGSVELHVRTSEWIKHGHQKDVHYLNVVLHVVFENDLPEPHRLPVLELQPHIATTMLHSYYHLMNASSFIACGPQMSQVRELTWLSWKERLLAERLTRKSAAILQMLHENQHHWEETFWWLLARNFGNKVNAEAFEAIARSLSITILARHKNNLLQLEALLLGQANLLQKDFEEEYPRLLQREYQFLQIKYRLSPVAMPVYFLRMRPGNFPTLRLAQLAQCIFQSSHLFSKVLETEKVQEVKQWLTVAASGYWQTHYVPDELSVTKPKKLGADMIDNIVINTLVPVLFAYGLYRKEENFKDKALRWLMEIAAENNSVINGFKEFSITNHNAYDSQALLELKNEYCTHKRCLECSVGNALLKKER